MTAIPRSAEVTRFKGVTDRSAPRRDGSLGGSTVAVLVAVGLTLGTVNVVSNYGHLPASPYLSKVVGNDWAWLAVGYLSARTGRSAGDAIRRSLLALIPATLIYYLLDWPLAHRATPGITVEPAGTVMDVVMWSIIASITSVGLGVLAITARRGGWRGLIAGAVVPAFIAKTAHVTMLAHDPSQPAANPETAAVAGAIWPIALAATVLALTIGLVRIARDSRRQGAEPVS